MRSLYPYILKTVFGIAFFCAAALPAFAVEENAGNVIAVRRQAWAERARGEAPLASKSPVFIGDTLATSPVGGLQVLFRDDSVLMMAPDTKTTVTEYAYGAGKKPAFGLHVARGVTRLISGRITEADPTAMTVETPEVIVTIQGTDLQIAAGAGVTEVSLLETSGKAVEICDKALKECLSLTRPATVIFRAGSRAMPRIASLNESGLISMAMPIQEESPAPVAADATPGMEAEPKTIIAAIVLDTASDQGIAQPNVDVDVDATPPAPPVPPVPPTPPAVTFSGTYAGVVTGSIAGAAANGNFQMGIKDLSDAPAVSGISLYAATAGAEPAARTFSMARMAAQSTGQPQALSIYGDGNLATLGSDGTFAFTVQNRGTNAQLAGNTLLPGGYVNINGNTDGDTLNLDLLGSLDGETENIGLVGSGNKISDETGPVQQPPSIAPSFTGRYETALSGTIAGTQVAGTMHMGVRDLTGSAPTVNAVSMYASEKGWQGDALQAISIHGEGALATLNNNGGFQFRSGRESTARLSGTNLLPEGYVDVTGSTDGSYLDVGMQGSLDGTNQNISLSGTGSKNSTTTPGLGDLPTPPAISPTFSGRYQAALSGSIAGTQVTGAAHMGVRDLTGSAPTVNAVSMYASEKGWQGDARQAISVYGEGDLATLGADGTFSFNADRESAARLSGTNLLPSGKIAVNGSVDGYYLNMALAGSLDGENQNITISGNGPKNSFATPGLDDLPTPPAISPSFNGRYSGNLGGALAGTQVTGQFHMGIKDLAATPTVNAVSMYVSEKGWQVGAEKALSIYGEGNFATLTNAGGFQFRSTGASAAKLQANGLLSGGFVDVSGSLDGYYAALGLQGSLDGETSNVDLSGTIPKTSHTSPGLGDLPVPPSIASSFGGRYSGDLAGALGGTSVTGAYHLGIKDLTAAPTVSAISLFASEIGWGEGAMQAVSVYGEGNLASLDASGNFTFSSTGDSAAQLGGHAVTPGGSVTVSGFTDGNAINLGLNGLLDGSAVAANVSGSGAKTSSTTPGLNDLPSLPTLGQSSFSGSYNGNLTGLADMGSITSPMTGSFGIDIADIANQPMVTSVNMAASDTNMYMSVSISGAAAAGLTNLQDAAFGLTAFTNTADPSAPVKMDVMGMSSTASAAISGSISGDTMTVNVAGSELPSVPGAPTFTLGGTGTR